MRIANKVLAFASHLFGIDELFYWLNRKAKRVLAFHNVLPDDLMCLYPHAGVVMSESAFRTIIREVKRRWPISIDLDDPSTLTLTFDDGYLNQYSIAGKILKEEGNIPAILFIAGNLLDASSASQALVVDKLLHWVAGVPDGIVTQQGASSREELWQRVVRPAFARDSEGRGENALAAFDSVWPMAKIYERYSEEYLRLRLTGIPEACLDELRGRGWRIGWHTKTHHPLSSLSPDAKTDEMMPPSGFKAEPFAYPYGELSSVDFSSIELARRLGYPCAVSCICTPNPFVGDYFIPRICLPANTSEANFVLSGLKHFCKYGKLLSKSCR